MGRHAGVGGTLPLTEATVPTIPPGQVKLPGPRSGVDGDGLANDNTVGHELTDRLARVGGADLGDLVGVEPNLALTATDD